MKVAYVGDLSHGTTSWSRFNAFNRLNGCNVFGIDTGIPIRTTSRLFRSLGWRFYIGPLISNINSYILTNLAGHFDIIWIDKGYFIELETILTLKAHTKILVHYTPDVAFVKFRSKIFLTILPYFDCCYTTKSFEVQLYRQYGCREIVFCTQGFDEKMLQLDINLEEKKGVVFIGLCEKYRANLIGYLVDNGISVKVGGVGWTFFRLKYRNNPNFIFLGNHLFGEDYHKAIANSKFGLGLLSKRFNELHTTRTFEIPACKTILITERNEELLSFFENDEVLFFDSQLDLVNKLKNFNNNEDMALKGYQRVIKDKRDYYQFLVQEFVNRYNV